MPFHSVLLSLLLSFVPYNNEGVRFTKIYHAVYISVIEIERTSNDQQGTLKVKVFIDDLQDAIHNKTGHRSSYRSGCKSGDQELISYFKDHIKLEVNTQLVDISLIDCERLEDSLWLNFIIDSDADWNELTISADYFMELFPTQSNIISVANLGENQFSRLNKGSDSAHFNFSR